MKVYDKTDMLKELSLRFSSSNHVPVKEARITKDEFEQLHDELVQARQTLKDNNELLDIIDKVVDSVSSTPLHDKPKDTNSTAVSIVKERLLIKLRNKSNQMRSK